MTTDFHKSTIMNASDKRHAHKALGGDTAIPHHGPVSDETARRRTPTGPVGRRIRLQRQRAPLRASPPKTPLWGAFTEAGIRARKSGKPCPGGLSAHPCRPGAFDSKGVAHEATSKGCSTWIRSAPHQEQGARNQARGNASKLMLRCQNRMFLATIRPEHL